jgi:hypothetical protein
MRKLTWKPIRRGLIYCSSACGHDCTKAEYDKAFSEARTTLAKMKTRGWKIRVWENMGWHWSLTNALCGMSLHTTHDVRGLTFWGMMADGDCKNAQHGSCGFQSCSHNSKDPNKAVTQLFKSSLPWFEAQARGLANLKSIL